MRTDTSNSAEMVMEAGMSLDQMLSHEPFASEVVSTPLPNGPISEADATAVLWLTMGRPASREFRRMTRSMREAIIVREEGPDRDPSAWLARGAAMLEQADPGLGRSPRGGASHARPGVG